jgi:hypothetical protein
MKSSRVLACLLVVAALALGACGGSKTPTGSGSNPPATTGGGGGIPGFGAGDCASAARAMALAAAGGFGGQNAFGQDASTALNRLADAAPSAVRGDIKTVATAVGAFYKALKDAGIDFTNPSSFQDPSKAQALQKASQDFEASGAKAAGERVTNYFRSICPSP